jgi:hypothetical protein
MPTLILNNKIMARLTASESEKLRQDLLAAINTGAAVSQTATEWHQSGFQKYTRAQVKRQLEALGRARKSRSIAAILVRAMPRWIDQQHNKVVVLK